jgi:hypothetical protein
MARQTIVKTLDDLDGTEGAETVTFGLDGVLYAIDLNDTNAGKLRQSFAPYLASATRIGKASTNGNGAVTTGTRRATGIDTKAARVWLRENGYTVPDRGRLKPALAEAYKNRTPAPKPPRQAKPAAADNPISSANRSPFEIRPARKRTTAKAASK